jgi:hypothetical protein
MTDGIRRFPRLLEGAQGAALTRMFWTEPELPRVTVAKDGMSINFVFKVRIRKEALDEPFQRYWSCFFAPPAHQFEKTLYEGYQKTMSGKKTVHRHISTFLRRAFRNAFQIWLENSWGLNGYEPRKEDQLRAFEQQAEIQPGPQPNAAVAVKVFQLYEKNSQLVKEVRHRLKQNVGLTTDRALAMVVEKIMPAETVRMALRKISSDPKADLCHLAAEGIGTAEIAQTITELEMPGLDFEKVSFRKHRTLGKRLLRENLWKTSV